MWLPVYPIQSLEPVFILFYIILQFERWNAVFHHVFNFQLPVRLMIFVFTDHLYYLFCELPIHIISLFFIFVFFLIEGEFYVHLIW